MMYSLLGQLSPSKIIGGEGGGGGGGARPAPPLSLILQKCVFCKKLDENSQSYEDLTITSSSLQSPPSLSN